MKKNISFIVIFICFVNLNSVLCDEFESLEVDENGNPTGITKVYELEWISTDTLQVTYGERSSSPADKVFLYNETPYSVSSCTIICNSDTLIKSSISCGSNTKYIPFDDSGYYQVDNCDTGCKCIRNTDCGATIDPGCALLNDHKGMRCIAAGTLPCPGICLKYDEVSLGGTTVYSGYSGGILINADNVVIIE